MAEQEGRALAEKLQTNNDESQNVSNKFEEEESNDQLESVEESKTETDQ